MRAAPSEAGFVARVLTAWIDPRASMRSILASDPGEARVLSFAMLSGALLFVARAIELAAGAAPLPAEVPAEAAFASVFLFQVMVWPLLLYGLAAVVGLLARAAGGDGGWRDTRAAVCWAAMIQAPIELLFAVFGVATGLARTGGAFLSLVASLFLVVALAYCISEAHGFTRVWIVFAILGGGTALVWAGVLSLTI